MQIELFTIPMLGGADLLGELNHFLKLHRVTDVQKTAVASGGVNYWAFCITYLPQADSDTKIPGTKKGKIDYREVLEESVFARFAELRKIRKQIADAEAIPPYAIFTDAELAEVAKLETITLKSLKTIPGVGEKKIEKYGNRFCIIWDETSGISDGENSRL